MSDYDNDKITKFSFIIVKSYMSLEFMICDFIEKLGFERS